MNNTLFVALVAWIAVLIGVLLIGLLLLILRTLFGDMVGTILFLMTGIVAGAVGLLERLTSK